ncbi:fucolectin-like [Mercenaria mercenaria]|uniref:fucolectin-like n=1 Tax=Mercenaria mercenaria TaxID=6596 RepID=UPI00234E644A|nr:fucolectin-like [Mercenaria mercenaria]
MWPLECTRIGATNVALLGKQTVMSSVINGFYGAKGVDGNTNQEFNEGTCFITDPGTQHTGTLNPWWRVDLGALYHIVNVTFFNRIDGCGTVGCGYRASNLRLSMGTSLETINVVGTVPGQIEDIHTFSFPESKQARYVQVTLEGQKKILHLCEVQVFGFPRLQGRTIDLQQVS